MTELNDYEQLIRRLLRARSIAGSNREGLLAESSDAAEIARELEPLWRTSGLEVTEVRVNGARVDVRIHSDDGRAWLAVLWFDDHRSPKLVAVTTYERPNGFRSGEAGLVVVLNGPSSVGKSSLMAAFADAASTPWACVDEPMFGRFATKFLAWPAAAGPVAEGFLAALAAAARLGNRFIVSSGGITQARFREALADIPTFYVGLVRLRLPCSWNGSNAKRTSSAGWPRRASGSTRAGSTTSPSTRLRVHLPRQPSSSRGSSRDQRALFLAEPATAQGRSRRAGRRAPAARAESRTRSRGSRVEPARSDARRAQVRDRCARARRRCGRGLPAWAATTADANDAEPSTAELRVADRVRAGDVHDSRHRRIV